ncbi:MAG: hypothetical protein ACM33V_12420, partial [Chloroflexota bacterium]
PSSPHRPGGSVPGRTRRKSKKLCGLCALRGSISHEQKLCIILEKTINDRTNTLDKRPMVAI